MGKLKTCRCCGLVIPTILIKDRLCVLCNYQLNWLQEKHQESLENFSSWWKDREKYIIIDTETTGLNEDDEIIEISILSLTGETLLDTLVKPKKEIPQFITKLTGITNEMVSKAPVFSDVLDDINRILKGKILLTFNAKFDIRMIDQSLKNYGLSFNYDIDSVKCVMLEYAQYFGEYRKIEQDFKRKSLKKAIETEGINLKQNHRSLGDCELVLELIKSIATKNLVLQEVANG